GGWVDVWSRCVVVEWCDRKGYVGRHESEPRVEKSHEETIERMGGGRDGRVEPRSTARGCSAGLREVAIDGAARRKGRIGSARGGGSICATLDSNTLAGWERAAREEAARVLPSCCCGDAQHRLTDQHRNMAP